VLLARMLGAEGYGIYAYAFALVTLLAMPAKAGLPQLVVRETARGVAGKPLDSVYIHLYIF
jgi:O-antigen/teichoic acid export membrane protein